MCYFYINSINARKQAELIPWPQRQDLLKLLLEGADHRILTADRFAAHLPPEGISKETVFLPMVEKLAAGFGRSEVWLVRG